MVAAPQPETRRVLMMPLTHRFLIKFHMDAAMTPKNAKPAMQNSTLATKASGFHRGIAVTVKQPRRQIYTSAGSHQLPKYSAKILFIISHRTPGIGCGGFLPSPLMPLFGFFS